MYRSFNHAKIYLVILNHVDNAVCIGHLELNVDVRVLCAKITQQRGQHVFRNRGTGPQRQCTADFPGDLAHRVFHLAIQFKDFYRVFVNYLPGLGEADTVVRTIKQAGIELFFQLPDLESDSWLRHVQMLCSLGKAQ